MQNKIIGIVKNYPNKFLSYPVFFSKPWSSILNQDESNIIKLKEDCKVNYEFELGVVIGKETKCIKQDDYLNYIGGYVLGLDLTELTRNPLVNKNHNSQLISKGMDYFTPLGEFIEKEKIVDPNQVFLELYINDKLVQNGKTGDLVYKISEQICILSYYTTLFPGDIILTGTYNNPNLLFPGDKIRGTSFITNNVNEKKELSNINFKVDMESTLCEL